MGLLGTKLSRWIGSISLRLHSDAVLHEETALPPEDRLGFPACQPSQIQPLDEFLPIPESHPIYDEMDRPQALASALPPTPLLISAHRLSAHLLGSFRLSLNDFPIDKPPTGRSGSLFKYLLYHHQRRIPREVLMDEFWPDAEPEVARNRMNVAISNIRHILRRVIDIEAIVFDDSKYFINPELEIWLDVEEMEASLEQARKGAPGNPTMAIVKCYEAAANLYQGDFLQDDLYDEWTVPVRERLRLAFLNTLFRLARYYFDTHQYTACVGMCQSILERDDCREDVHCLLMRTFAYQNQFYLALRQYQLCMEALRAELDVAPAPTTIALYQKLRRRELAAPIIRT